MPTSALAIYELMEDNDALSDAHLLFAQSLLDGGDTERAATHLAAARSLLGTRPTPADLGFVVVEEARLALSRATASSRRRGPATRSSCSTARERPVSWAMPTWCWPGSTTSWARASAPSGRTRRRSARSAARAAGRASWPRPTAGTASSSKRMGRAEAALEAFELAADLAPSNQDALAPAPQSGVSSTLTTP